MAVSVKTNATADGYILRGLQLESNVHEVWDLNMTGLANAIIYNTLPTAVMDKLTAIPINYSDYAVMDITPANLTTFAVRLKGVLEQLPHGGDGGDFSRATYISGMVLTIVTGIIVLLRIFSRIKLGTGVKLEDWIILFASAMSIVMASLMQHSTVYGGGTHIYDCTYKDIYWVIKCLFVCQFIYLLGIMSAKVSLLVFYFRLSPKLWYKYAVAAVGLFATLMTIAFMFSTIFQCKPIAFWKDFYGRKCLNELAYWTAFGVLSMISDVMIWLLPIPVVWGLGLAFREKVVVTALFSLGLLVCIASLVRLLSINSFVKNVDFTSREAATGLWSLVELDVAIICASIPALKGLCAACPIRAAFSRYTSNTTRGEPTKPTCSYLTTTKTSTTKATTNTHFNNSSSETSEATGYSEKKDRDTYVSTNDDIEAAAQGEYRASVDSGEADDFFVTPSFPGSPRAQMFMNRRSLGPPSNISNSTLDNISDTELGSSFPDGGLMGLRPRETTRPESRREVDEEGNTIGPMYSHGVPLRAGLRKPSAVSGRKGSLDSRKGSVGTRKGSMTSNRGSSGQI